MKRKQFAVATLLALISLTLVVIPASQLVGSYDPWLDYNDDGMIDAHDVHPLGQAYGSSGDPTKNVNVTNWPVQHELFPQNLILRAAYYSSLGVPRRDLFDSTTTPPPEWVETFPTDSIKRTLTTTMTEIYNNTFIYQKIPTSAYQILGMPIVTLTFNVTNSPSASFGLYVYVYLGKISMDWTWTQVAYLGSESFGFYGALTDLQWKRYTVPLVPLNTMINAYERLAVRIVFSGLTSSGTTELTLEILLGTNTDVFIVDVPIVENPTPPYTP